MSGNTSLSRRRSLALIVKLMLSIAMAAFVWVIFSSLNLSTDNEDKTASHNIYVDLENLGVGKIHKVSSGYREIWIYHRSEHDIKQLRNIHLSLRSNHPTYFVFYPYEKQRNCQVNWDEHNKQFFDPCFGNYFDLSGRMIGEGRKNEVKELSVPEHQFISETQLEVDTRWMPFR